MHYSYARYRGGIDGSWFTCDWWRRDLHHLGSPVRPGVHHRDVICPSTRDVRFPRAAADPLVIYSLVGVESAVCGDRVLVTRDWLSSDLPARGQPEDIIWFRDGNEHAAFK